MPNGIQPSVVSAFRQALTQMGVKPNSMPTPEPDRALMLDEVSRAINVVGLILEGIEKERKTGTVAGRFIARVGRVLWAVVAAATPQSTARLLTRYWFSLLLLFEMVVILGAAVFSSASAQSFGIKLFVFTLCLRFCIEVIWLYIRRKSLIAVLGAVFFAFAVLSLLTAAIVRFAGIHSIGAILSSIANGGLMSKGLACLGVLLIAWAMQWFFARPQSEA